ncbi:hypothetical protein [Endozoicomonas lisbonensis]|uniref:Lipoprotein n=1 Tax=Endozoicomonas lisbonensis TaxID=3120522 RepID=A0ABV2SHJ7_9GAMM
MLKNSVMLKNNVFALLVLFLLAGCQSSGIPNLYREGLPGTASWAVLPFANYTESENVATQVERILMVMLPSNGIDEPQLYPEFMVTSANNTLADAHRIQNGRQWAAQSGISFAFSGAVNEWMFDDEGRPRVALSLNVTDVRSDETLWSISGASEGLPGDDLYAVSRGLINDLLRSLPINRRL